MNPDATRGTLAAGAENAARSAKGREKVLAWLKQLERHEARQARGGQPAYESDWIWKELGIERPVLTISGT